MIMSIGSASGGRYKPSQSLARRENPLADLPQRAVQPTRAPEGIGSELYLLKQHWERVSSQRYIGVKPEELLGSKGTHINILA